MPVRFIRTGYSYQRKEIYTHQLNRNESADTLSAISFKQEKIKPARYREIAQHASEGYRAFYFFAKKAKSRDFAFAIRLDTPIRKPCGLLSSGGPTEAQL